MRVLNLTNACCHRIGQKNCVLFLFARVREHRNNVTLTLDATRLLAIPSLRSLQIPHSLPSGIVFEHTVPLFFCCVIKIKIHPQRFASKMYFFEGY